MDFVAPTFPSVSPACSCLSGPVWSLLVSCGCSWGRNCNGQGGFGDIETYGDDPNEMGDALPYVDLGTGRSAVSISAGVAHVCAVLDDGSVKCWGKGYFGQTGLEQWNSVGQAPGQMGDSLPALDLGTGTGTASSGRRKLRGLQAGAAATTPVSVDSVSAGGQRSCAIVDGGSVKCWGNAFAGALGLGDTVDRGGRAGSMGDALPLLSLGTGKVAVSPAPLGVATVAPTPAPTVAATAAATLEPTEAKVRCKVHAIQCRGVALACPTRFRLPSLS